MENGQSNHGSSGGVSGKLAAILGLLYSIGVVGVFAYYTLTLNAEEAILKKSLLRLTYIIFFFCFIGLVLWAAGIAKSESGFLMASLFFNGCPIVYWMSDTFYQILNFLAVPNLYEDKALFIFWVETLTAVFFMAFYFVLMTCYCSLRNSFQRNTSERPLFADGFDWKVAGFAHSFLMLAFVIGATRIIHYLPIELCIISLALVMTVVFWVGVVNGGKKRLLSGLIFWGLFLVLLIGYEFLCQQSQKWSQNPVSFNVIYFTVAFSILAFYFAVKTYSSIIKAKRLGFNKSFNQGYTLASNGNKELNV